MTLDEITQSLDQCADELRILELQITTTILGGNEQSEAYRAAWEQTLAARHAVERAGNLEGR